MNKTKQDVQLELLREIDSICEQNGLHYFLFGKNAYNAFKNHTIKNGSQTVSVAMTKGDAERFCEIAQKNQNRYVEGLFNNPKFNDLYIAYGDKNTTEISVERSNFNECHGIFVKIFFIKKATDLQGNTFKEGSKKIKIEKKLRNYLYRKIISPSLWFVILGQRVIGFLYSHLGEKSFYNNVFKNVSINDREELKQLKTVKIENSNEILAETVLNTKKYEVDGILLNLPEDAEEFFKEYYAENFKNVVIKRTHPSQRKIVCTNVPYEKVLEDNKDIFTKARKHREQVLWNRLFSVFSRKTVNSTIAIASMTKVQMELQSYYADKTQELLRYDLDDEKQFEICCRELKPLLSELYKYSLKGLTFSVNKDIDELAIMVLTKKDRFKTIKRINKIKNRRYFVK